MGTDEPIRRLCHNVCNLRKAKGLSQKEMARLLGVPIEALFDLQFICGAYE